MKVIKLDRRYAGFPKWKYAIDFGTRKYGRLERQKYVRGFTKLFGPHTQANPNSVSWTDWYLYNENWYHDIKHGRILYNNEGDLSAALLVIDQ